MNTEKLIGIAKQYPLAIICGLASLLMLAAIYLRGSALSGADMAYQEALKQVEEIDKNEQNAVGLQEAVDEINELVENVNSRLLVEDAKADHYRYFLALAEASDVSLKDPAFGGMFIAGEKGTTILTAQLSQIEYRIVIQGDFNKVLDFIYRVRTGRKFMRLNSLILMPDLAGKYGSTTANMTIRALAETPPKPES